MAPHNVQASGDGKILAVGAGVGGEGHAAHGTAGHLVLVDTTRAKPVVVSTIVLPGHPAHVVTDAKAQLAYVTDAESNAVIVVDLSSNTIAGSIAVGKYPHGLRMSPDEREIYVANMRDGSLSVIDVTARKEVARVAVGKAPVQVGFTPDGKRAFTSLNGENAVAIIDTAKRTVVAKRAVGRGPVQVYSSSDGRTIYVANQGSQKRPDNRLSLVPMSGSAKVIHVVTGGGAHGVAVSRDGSIVAVTNTYAGTATVIDTKSNKVLSALRVGAGPNGVTILDSAPLQQQ